VKAEYHAVHGRTVISHHKSVEPAPLFRRWFGLSNTGTSMKIAQHLLFVAAATASFAIPTSTLAAALTPGDLLVYRIGNGATALASSGNSVFVDEWTPTGTYVQTITTGIYASGTATSEGELTVSPDGNYYGFTGYQATASGGVAASTSAADNRMVGLLNLSGTVTKQGYTNFASGNNPRAAITTDGTNVWLVGATGIAAGTMGNSSVTSLSTQNTRNAAISGGQLYISSSSGTYKGVDAVGTGLPTTGSPALSLLAGADTGTSSSVYSFLFANLGSAGNGFNTLYVADDSANQIQKYSLVAGAWQLSGAVTAAGVRGLSGEVVGNNFQLFGSTGSSTATGSGTVYGFLDTTGFNGAVSGSAATLFTNATLSSDIGGTTADYAFRGIQVVIPEPSTYAMIAGVAVLGFALLRRGRSAAQL
jgi:hypothetical protein